MKYTWNGNSDESLHHTTVEKLRTVTQVKPCCLLPLLGCSEANVNVFYGNSQYNSLYLERAKLPCRAAEPTLREKTTVSMQSKSSIPVQKTRQPWWQIAYGGMTTIKAVETEGGGTAVAFTVNYNVVLMNWASGFNKHQGCRHTPQMEDWWWRCRESTATLSADSAFLNKNIKSKMYFRFYFSFRMFSVFSSHFGS